MTKEEKIILLKKMLKLNFRRNFFTTFYAQGLCSIWHQISPEGTEPLHLAVPEIVPKLNNPSDVHFYWWEQEGYFKPWWERHKAIRRTIKKLKKS